jgi:hypothetical protein
MKSSRTVFLLASGALAPLGQAQSQVIDPWYDFLAIPVAPVIIAAQGLAFTFPRPRVAAIVGVIGFLAILAMFVYMLTGVDTSSGDPSIGAGVLLIEAIGAAALMIAAILRYSSRRRTPPLDQS